jgi:hypothetical protein
MIASVHLAELGVRGALLAQRKRPRPGAVAGLLYAELTVTAALSPRLLPAPNPGRVGLIAAWEDDSALDEFLANDPLARQMAGGWHVRLVPLRTYGEWSALPGLPREELPSPEDEPVAVLTIGRLRLSRVFSFLSSSAAAESQALSEPALLAGTALARPPHLVATFSLWRSAHEMRAYAMGRSGGGHVGALQRHHAKPFHHESAFIRMRPYASQGNWDGRDPLANIPVTASP